MPEPQLSVRSAKARDLAHRLAGRERRSVADIVDRALEAYEVREAGREPAKAFCARLSRGYGTDIDLDAVIRESRQKHSGPELRSSSTPTSSRRRWHGAQPRGHCLARAKRR